MSSTALPPNHQQILALKGQRAIYHERVTMLIEILDVSEKDGYYGFEARIVKPLNPEQAERSGLYKKLIQKPSFQFGTKYKPLGELSLPYIEKHKIRGPYCPFMLWFNTELVKSVENSSGEESKMIAALLLAGRLE